MDNQRAIEINSKEYYIFAISPAGEKTIADLHRQVIEGQYPGIGGITATEAMERLYTQALMRPEDFEVYTDENWPERQAAKLKPDPLNLGGSPTGNDYSFLLGLEDEGWIE